MSEGLCEFFLQLEFKKKFIVMIGNICRCCFAEFPRLYYNLFEDGIVTDFTECLPSLNISQNDGLPDIICDLCLLRLREAVEFRRICEKSDSELRKMIQRNKEEIAINTKNTQMEKCLTNSNDVKKNQNDGMWNYEEILMLADDIFSANCTSSDDSIDVLLRSIPIATPSEITFLTCPSESSSNSDELQLEVFNGHSSDENENQQKRKKRTKRPPSRTKCHQCNLCEKKFTRNFQLKLHLTSVHQIGEGLRYKCQECSKVFASLHSLKYHQKSLHSKERPFACNHCEKCFVLRSQLMSHNRIHSDEEKPRIHECVHCGKLWPTKSDLKTHLRSHDPDLKRPFKCDACEKSFFTQGHLNSHLLVHTGEKPFTCQYCNKSFQSLGNVNNHIKKRHMKTSIVQRCKVLIN